MTASVVRSPTLTPFRSEGIVPQLGQSPPNRSSILSQSPPGRTTLHAHSNVQRFAAPKGLDSADIEARRQEKADVIANANEEASRADRNNNKQSNAAIAAAAAAATAATAAPHVQAKAIAALSEPSTITPDDEPQGPFEGPEKLMELWFADCQELLPEGSLSTSFTIMQDEDGNTLPGATPKRRLGLRAVSRPLWEEMLDLVHCKVLSVIEGDDFDAYLLSESSMFVFPHKIILKTCGTTTLLLGLQRILELAKGALSGSTAFPPVTPTPAEPYEEGAGSPDERKALGSLVRQCFYSRKSFMFPERQKGPHRDWMLEVQLLDAFFDDGSAYTVGKMNGDHWLLYMCCPGDKEAESPPAQVAVQRPLHLPSPGCIDAANDQTLEILMTHMSSRSCARFNFPPEMAVPSSQAAAVTAAATPSSSDRGHVLGLDLSAKLGLIDMFPGTIIDAFAFEPCGYSANAVIPASEGCSAGYWTIHVTPEEDSSYASFETNVRLPNKAKAARSAMTMSSLIGQVANIFEAGKMSITLFSSRRRHEGAREDCDGEGVFAHDGHEEEDDVYDLTTLKLPGYSRKDRIAYEFDSYDLVFVHFEALPSTGALSASSMMEEAKNRAIRA